MRGDTALVHYRLLNHAESRESLFVFTVDAPALVLSVGVRGTTADWSPDKVYRGRSVVRWAAIDSLLPPGAASPDLFFAAIGLPAIVTAWTQGYYPPQPLTAADTNPLVRPSDPLVENSVRVSVVGIAPPAATGPADLLVRLRGLGDESCLPLGWISNQGICQSLRAKLDNALAAVGRGNKQAAAGELTAYAQELEAQHGPQPGKHVNDSAYWLLKVNAEYILTRL